MTRNLSECLNPEQGGSERAPWCRSEPRLSNATQDQPEAPLSCHRHFGMQAKSVNSDIGRLILLNARRSSNRHGDGMDTESQLPPLCPNCAKPMRFTRLIPAIGALPELYSYYCDACSKSITEVGKPGERRDLLRYFEIDRAASRPN